MLYNVCCVRKYADMCVFSQNVSCFKFMFIFAALNNDKFFIMKRIALLFTNFSLEDLCSGTYIITLKTQSKSLTLKLIKL